MMLHAWENYKLYAWGANELRPISRQPNRDSVFGQYDLGATIVDSFSTLYIMGLNKEFEEGREWVANNFTMDNVVSDITINYCSRDIQFNSKNNSIQ